MHTPKGVFYMAGKYYILAILSLFSTLNPGSVNMASAPLPKVEISAPAIKATPATTIKKAEKIEYKTLEFWVTAYSSTPEETDETPFITASGIQVRKGIVATNMLPFGTLIKIPKYFGEQVFVVEDRMHERKENFIDIWMPSKDEAKNFGIHYTEILVLNENLAKK